MFCLGVSDSAHFYSLSSLSSGSIESFQIDLLSGQGSGQRRSKRSSIRFKNVVSLSEPGRPYVALSLASSPYSILLLDGEDRTILGSMSGHHDYCWGLESIPPVSPSESPRIVSGSEGGLGELFVFHAESGERLISIKEAPLYIQRILCVPEWNRNEIFVGAEQALMKYDIEHGPAGHTLGGFFEPGETGDEWLGWVCGLAADVSRRILLATSDDEPEVKGWSPQGKPLFTFHPDSIGGSYSVSCAPDLNLVFLGLGNGSVETWDLRNVGIGGTKRVDSTSLKHHQNAVHDIVSLGSTLFVSVGGETVSVWDAAKMGPKKVVWKRVFSREGPGTSLSCGVCSFPILEEERNSLEDQAERIQFLLGHFLPSRRLFGVEVHLVSAEASTVLAGWSWMSYEFEGGK